MYLSNTSIEGKPSYACSSTRHPAHGLRASANPKEGVEKVERYPGTTAEDMEGFGVAAACHLHSVPLWIIRGISNSVGERDHDQWQVEKAMKAAAKLLEKIIVIIH